MRHSTGIAASPPMRGTLELGTSQLRNGSVANVSPGTRCEVLAGQSGCGSKAEQA